VIIVAVLCGALLALLVEVIIMRYRLARVERLMARYKEQARQARRGAVARQQQVERSWRDMTAVYQRREN